MLPVSLVISLEPGLDGAVLLVEVVHVRHQILHNIHVGKRIDLCGFVICVDLGQASEGVYATWMKTLSLNILN